MPRDFLAFQDFELWMPLQMLPLARPADSTMTLFPFVVVNGKQNLTTILNEMNPATDGVNHDYPDLFNSGRHLALIPAHQMYTHAFAPIVTMLSLIAAAVLLIGGVNISMVFLARLLERSRELALRNALGASRARLMRQCLLETALIVLLGLVVGYGLAALGMRWVEGIDSFSKQIFASGRSTNLPVLRSFDLMAAVISAIVIWLLSTLIPGSHITSKN